MAVHDARTVRLRAPPAVARPVVHPEHQARQEQALVPHWAVLPARCRGARSWLGVLPKVRLGVAGSEQAGFLAPAARRVPGGQPAVLDVASSAPGRVALSWSEVPQKVLFGYAVSARPEFLVQAVRREQAVRQGARLAPFAPVSAAWPAERSVRLARAETVPQAESDALSRAAHGEAVVRVVWGGAAGLRLAAAPLAAPEPAAVLQLEARDAAEVQHEAALPSGLPSAAAFRAPCHDRVRPAPARSEQEASAHVMPCLRTASPSERL